MMPTIIIAIVVLIILLVFFIILVAITKRQNVDLATIDSKGRIKDEKGMIEQDYERENNKKSSSRGSFNFNANFNNIGSTVGSGINSMKNSASSAFNSAKSTVASKKGSEKVKGKEAVARDDIFKFMEFDRILDDMIVQKNGTRFTKAIKCKGINYDLMSEVEQLAVEEGFITFLNTLKYPIQLYVQAQNVDLKKTMALYKDNIRDLEDDYNNINNEYSKLASAFDTDEEELQKATKERDSITNVYEYARDMIKYVEKMENNKKMLKRSFYILVSYNTSEVISAEKFNKDELIDMCNTELTTRCQAIISALASCSVTGNMLNSNELAELLYNAYNRDDAGVMNVKENLESGFYRLYSTSEDAFMKKQQALEDYLNAEARLKALEAIKYAIMNNEYKTPAMEQLEEEEEISKRATNMVKNEDYEKDFKDKVNAKILSDYREVKKELLEEDAEQKKIMVEESKNDIAEIDKIKKEMANNPIGKAKKEYEDKKDQPVEEKNSTEGNLLDEDNNNNEDAKSNNTENAETDGSNKIEDEPLDTNIYSENDNDEDDEIIK